METHTGPSHLLRTQTEAGASATYEIPVKDRMVIDFTGKPIYVGIDIHQKDYQVPKVIDGVCLGNHRMAANVDLLIKHLHSCYPGAEFKCVYRRIYSSPPLTQKPLCC